MQEMAPMRGDRAERIALDALAWIAADDEKVGAFLAAAGTDAAGLRDAAREPAFLVAVIDFLTTRDDWVIAFCDGAGLPYDAPLRARAALPGGEEMHWT